MAFLQFPLSKLTEDYKNTGGNYEFLKKSLISQTDGILDEEKLMLLEEKLSFPHEKFNKVDDMQNCTSPLEKDDYSSSLTESTISDEMMDRIKSVIVLIWGSQKIYSIKDRNIKIGLKIFKIFKIKIYFITKFVPWHGGSVG